MAEKNDNVEVKEVPVSEAEVPEAPAEEAPEEAREPKAEVSKGEVPAQVAQPRDADADVVPVHEVAVTLDETITDPSDPRAVQVPDAGKGDSSLPIHNLAQPRPEDVFKKEASKPDKD